MPLELQDLSLVRRGRVTSVHRARLADGTAVYAKLVPEQLANRRHTVRLKHEYDLLREFEDCDRVINALRLDTHDGGVVLAVEDVGARTLKEVADGRPLELEPALDYGAQLCEALSQVHSRGVIHRDVNPTNAVVTPAGKVLLIDFGLATRETWQRSYAAAREAEGTLAYIAPEQTGRINQTVDTRADLYSLGATLYELFVGHRPFTSSDPMELMHAHIARHPVTAEAATEGRVPRPLSDVVAKLMAKAPKDRYQSAAGVRRDLELCLQSLRERGVVPSDLAVGALDASEQFSVAQKLYGRDVDVQRLLGMYEAVCAGGCQLALVAGYSGIGKTSLVLEMYSSISRPGYHISGKFNQLQRTVPYSAVVQAMSQLVRQLLGGSREELDEWRARLCQTLQPNTQLMVDVVPDLAHIVGPQPSVEAIPAAAAKARFESVFVKFVGVFCKPSTPLVIFLDDLQWADAASLALLELLMTSDIDHLLLVGAYRDNEVSEDHAMSVTVARVQASDKATDPVHITLQPLDEGSVRELVGDSLGGGEAADPGGKAAAGLARLALDKTAGNPFFLVQFLTAVHAAGHLRFDHDAARWGFDAAAIAGMDNTDNVVDLMISKVRMMPADAQAVLRMAACIGSHFDLCMLATVMELTVSEVFARLAPAVEARLAVVVSDQVFSGAQADVQRQLEQAELVVLAFKFLHDRVQQAAYDTIPAADRPRMHLTIGRLLKREGEGEGEGDAEVSELQLFTVTDHLNVAAELIEDAAERQGLAELNVAAALRARDSMAYQAALTYVQTAHRLAGGEACWEAAPAFAERLYRALVAIEFLNGEFERSERFVREAVARVSAPEDKASFYHHLIVAHTLRGQYPAAIATARTALALLGVDLPEDDRLDEVRDAELAEVEATLDAMDDLRALAEHPAISEAKWRIAVLLMTTMGPPCYRSHQRLWAVIVAKSVNICLKHGHVPSVAYSYTSLGGLMACVRGRFDWAEDLAWLSLRVSEQYNSSSDKSVALLMIGSSLRHWFDSMKRAEKDYMAGYEVGLHSGNLQYSAYCFGHDMYLLFFAGRPLGSLKLELERYTEFSASKKNQWAVEVMQGVDLVTCMLSGGALAPMVDDEAEYTARAASHGSMQVVVIYNAVRARALYLMGRFAEAWACTAVADEHIFTVATQGLLVWAEHVVTRALTGCALLQQGEAGVELEAVRADVALLRSWAQASPQSFEGRLRFVEAELAAVDPDAPRWDVMDLYSDAAEALTAAEYSPLAAAAHERAALFCYKHNRKLYATAHLRAAHGLFTAWGAHGVAQRLAEEHGTVVLQKRGGGGGGSSVTATGSVSASAEGSQEAPAPAAAPAQDSGPATTTTTTTTATTTATTTSNNSAIDSKALVEASQAISGEVHFESLARTLMGVMLRMSGANRGALLMLEEAEEWVLAARAEVDGNGEPVVELGRMAAAPEAPLSVVQFAARTGEVLVLDDASSAGGRGDFARDSYWAANGGAMSLMCIPLTLRGSDEGGAAAIVLENTLAPQVFTRDRVSVLRLLSQQVAISLDNSRLFAQYHEMYAGAVAGLLRVKPSGEILRANPACRRMLQLSDALGGSTGAGALAFLEFVQPDGLARWLESVGSASLEGYEAQVADGRGGALWVSINAKAVCGADGAVRALDVSLHDVSAAKQQAELEQKRQAAEAASKAKSDFLGVVAHEIRTPLNAILCTAEIAGQNAQEEQIVEDLGMIHRAGTQLLTLLNEVLDHSKVEAGKLLLNPAPFRLRSTLRDVVKIMSANVVSKPLELNSSVGEDVPDALIGDDGRISQCLLNLCNNAIKFTDDGSVSINVTAEPAGDDGAAVLLRFAVVDTGRGIEPEALDHLFDPYTQATASTWRSHGGTGLGLSIVRQLVELMHGQVGVASEGVGRGATFWFTVRLGVDASDSADGPAQAGAAAEEEAAPAPAEASPEERLPRERRAGVDILVVEDSRTNRKVAGMLCKTLGFTSYEFANDGQMAVDMASERRFDVILMDLHMPVMDGVEATRILCERQPAVPIIGVTAAADAEDRQKCIDAGMVAVVEKPIQRSLLEEALVRVLS